METVRKSGMSNEDVIFFFKSREWGYLVQQIWATLSNEAIAIVLDEKLDDPAFEKKRWMLRGRIRAFKDFVQAPQTLIATLEERIQAEKEEEAEKEREAKRGGPRKE